MFVRKNVWGLSGTWPDELLWYARGVKAMKARPLATPTSWRFYAGIHGFNQALWQQLGYFATTDKLPSSANVKKFWDQCQHGSWYFLPWHRGYLLAFEKTVRAAIVAAGGPADWALPYWNYFKSGQSALPKAFATPKWPDGANDNPLFVAPRYGPNGDGKVVVPVQLLDLDALNDPDFEGVVGGSPGFGGLDTGFHHGGGVHGALETNPHDYVHGLVGGARNNNRQFPGAMSIPASAALDPIFWLHHANIDRLWSSWLRPPTTHANPTDTAWKRGPTATGERKFRLPLPNGTTSTTWTYTPADMVDTATLGYQYDDLVPAGASRRRVAPPGPQAAGFAIEGAPMATSKRNVELVGASPSAMRISGADAGTDVRMDPAGRNKVAASRGLAVAQPAPAEPDRVFLNLENVRGKNDATSFAVYVGVPAGADVADYPSRLAGKVALFGVRAASDPDGGDAGQGLTYVFDITRIVDELHAENNLDVDDLAVRIVPNHPVADDEQLTIGRISIFRQGR